MSIDRKAAMRKLNLSDLFTVAVGRHGSQACVAKKCGISQSMVSLYLSGKHRTIKAANLPKIARCLGVKPSVLISACVESGSSAS